MTLRALGDLLIYLGAVAGAISAIGWLVYRAAVKPFIRWLKAEVAATRHAAETGSSTAAKVHAEVTPNHGHSLKDSVTRTELEVKQLRRELLEHITNHPGAST